MIRVLLKTTLTDLRSLSAVGTRLTPGCVGDVVLQGGKPGLLPDVVRTRTGAARVADVALQGGTPDVVRPRTGAVNLGLAHPILHDASPVLLPAAVLHRTGAPHHFFKTKGTAAQHRLPRFLSGGNNSRSPVSVETREVSRSSQVLKDLQKAVFALQEHTCELEGQLEGMGSAAKKHVGWVAAVMVFMLGVFTLASLYALHHFSVPYNVREKEREVNQQYLQLKKEQMELKLKVEDLKAREQKLLSDKEELDKRVVLLNAKEKQLKTIEEALRKEE